MPSLPPSHRGSASLVKVIALLLLLLAMSAPVFVPDAPRSGDTQFPAGPAGDSPAAAGAGAKPRSGTLLSVDFEDGDGGFTHWGEFDCWERGVPGGAGNNSYPGTTPAPSGDNVFGTLLNGSYPKYGDMFLATPELDLRDMESASVDFWMWLDLSDDDGDTGGGSTGEDELRLFRSNSSTPDTWRHLATFNGSNSAQESWFPVSLELDDLTGERVMLAWRLKDHPDDLQGAGAFIDDVDVSAVPRNNRDITLPGSLVPDVSAPGEDCPIDVLVQNSGLSDIDDAQLTLTVLDPEGTKVHLETLPLATIPRDGETVLRFTWVPEAYGTHEWSVLAELAGDGETDDNQLSGTVDAYVPVACDDVEGGTGSFSHSASQGEDAWAIYDTDHDDGAQVNSQTRSWGFHEADSGGYPPLTRAHLTFAGGSLTGATRAWFSFWHWYDLESDGVHYDGALVEASVDGGGEWRVLEPRGGYPGTITDTTGNPLGGARAYVGSSGVGLTRAVFALTDLCDGYVMLRFTAGTDAAGSGKGWFIDDPCLYTVPFDGDTGLVLSDGAEDEKNPFTPYDIAAGAPGGAWHTTDGDSFTGAWSWHFGENGTEGYLPYSDSAISTELDLRWVDPPVLMTFWHRYGFHLPEGAGPGAQADDGGVIEVKAMGGGDWTPVAPLGGYPGSFGSGAPGGLEGLGAYTGVEEPWSRGLVDLTNLTGAQCSVRFRAVSDSGDDGPGWYVDRIRVMAGTQKEELNCSIFADHPSAGAVPEPLELDFYRGCGLEIPLIINNSGNIDAHYDMNVRLTSAPGPSDVYAYMDLTSWEGVISRGEGNSTIMRVSDPEALLPAGHAGGPDGNGSGEGAAATLLLEMSLHAPSAGGTLWTTRTFNISLTPQATTTSAEEEGDWSLRSRSGTDTRLTLIMGVDAPLDTGDDHLLRSVAGGVTLEVGDAGGGELWACVPPGTDPGGRGRDGGETLGAQAYSVVFLNLSVTVSASHLDMFEPGSASLHWYSPDNRTWYQTSGPGGASPLGPGGGGDVRIHENFTLSPWMPSSVQLAFLALPDSTPPAQVSSVRVSDDGNGSLLVEWDPSEETDFSHYSVYASRFPFQAVGNIEPEAEVYERNTTQVSISGLERERTYYFAVTATDTAGNTDRNATGVEGALVSGQAPNILPVAIIEPLGSDVVAGELTYFYGGRSYDQDGRILEYSWDFDKNDGLDANSRDINPTHTFGLLGEYTVTLTVTDDRGGKDFSTIDVTVRSGGSGGGAEGTQEGEEGRDQGTLVTILAVTLLVAFIFLLAFGRGRRPTVRGEPGAGGAIERETPSGDEDAGHDEEGIPDSGGEGKGMKDPAEVFDMEVMGTVVREGKGARRGPENGAGSGRDDDDDAGKRDTADGEDDGRGEVGHDDEDHDDVSNGIDGWTSVDRQRGGGDGDFVMSGSPGVHDGHIVPSRRSGGGGVGRASGDNGALAGDPGGIEGTDGGRESEDPNELMTLLCPDCDRVMMFSVDNDIINAGGSQEVECQHCGATGVLDADDIAGL